MENCNRSKPRLAADPDAREFEPAIKLVGSALDDPDQSFFEAYACKSEMNHARYRKRKVDAMMAQQSFERDPEKRRVLTWAIDSQIQQDVGQPIIWHERTTTCLRPDLKGLTLTVNSQKPGFPVAADIILLDPSTSRCAPLIGENLVSLAKVSAKQIWQSRNRDAWRLQPTGSAAFPPPH